MGRLWVGAFVNLVWHGPRAISRSSIWRLISFDSDSWTAMARISVNPNGSVMMIQMGVIQMNGPIKLILVNYELIPIWARAGSFELLSLSNYHISRFHNLIVTRNCDKSLYSNSILFLERSPNCRTFPFLLPPRYDINFINSHHKLFLNIK